ncbi:MAG: cyclodeaminase/cyclohydrolase family protein [Thermoanaerobaculia bacterium]
MTDLADLTLRDFTASLASSAPAPGGGSASAATGAAGAALLEMVVQLTLGKEKYRESWEVLAAVPDRMKEIRGRLLELVDEDTRAYEAIVASRKLPKETDADKSARQQAIDHATLLATTVPMQTAFFAGQALALAPLVAEKGNPNASSDAFVGALLLSAAVEGALANVRINLGGVADKALRRGFREDAEDLEKKAAQAMSEVREIARARTIAL